MRVARIDFLYGAIHLDIVRTATEVNLAGPDEIAAIPGASIRITGALQQLRILADRQSLARIRRRLLRKLPGGTQSQCKGVGGCKQFAFHDRASFGQMVQTDGRQRQSTPRMADFRATCGTIRRKSLQIAFRAQVRSLLPFLSRCGSVS